jgi:transcriptional regulator with XRE-family HTH domain
MSTLRNKLIVSLRNQKKLSQNKVASDLGMSRQSYMAVEQGKKDLTVGEAEKLAQVFGISLQELLGGDMSDYEKYKQMILSYLRTSISPDGKVPKTKLAKLVYLADFAWYYQHLKSMSGMSYRRIAYGPVPDTYFRAIDELEEEGKITVDRKGEALLVSEARGSARDRLNKLSVSEQELIAKISKKWEGKKTKEIVDFTHGQLPYKICAPEEIIPYELIIQENPGYVY